MGGSGAGDDLEADGEAAVTFRSGKPLPSADDEETPDSRRERITDRDLVWPGKVETIQITNPEAIAYRFDLTVTDLNPAFYIRRPPTGGVPQREGGVLLQPGDGASFEVVFVPPPAGEKLKTRTFGFVLTCFDPRRSGDPGEIVQDLPLRWVGLPTEGDLQLTAAPPVVVIRPWRREAKFAVRLANKSYLPPTVGMTILRAPTKDALEREAETAGAIQQSLAARTPGDWDFTLPPSFRRGSYYATVRGAAQAAESVSIPLALPRPVLIRYVPWLRMGRDWAALFVMLAFLLWLVWGFPIHKHPVIAVTVAFEGLKAGQVPEGANPRDLNPTLTLLDEDNTPLTGQTPIVGSFNGSQLVFKGPQHVYGYRWPFGWGWPSRSRQRYQVSLAPKEGKEAEFSSYTFPAQSDSAYLDVAQARSLWSAWKVPQAIHVARSPGAVVLIDVGDLGGLKNKTIDSLTINYVLDGQLKSRICPLHPDGHKGFKPLELPLTDQVPPGKSPLLTLRATALGVESIQSGGELTVRRQQGYLHFPDPLTFPATLTATPEQMAAAARTEARAKAKQDEADKKKQAQEAAARARAAVAPVQPGPGAGGLSAAAVPVAPPPSHPGKPAGHGGRPLVAGNQGNPPNLGHKPTPFTYHPTGPTPIPTTPPFNPTPISPPPLMPPPVPEQLKAENAGPGRIYVHWNRVPSATRYVLWRSGGPGHGPGEEHLSADETSFSDTGLAPGVVYHYRIQSKNGAGTSPQSNPTSLMTPALATAPATTPATVTLKIYAKGKDIHAVLEFANASLPIMYLNKVYACEGGKIGDDVFTVQVDGVPLSFTGRESKQPSTPGLRQFSKLAIGERVSHEVILNHSYGFPPGTQHVYRVTYSAKHDYGVQTLPLTSNEADLDTTR